MGISRLDAMIIQSRGDDIKVQAGGPSKDGKWAMWIMLYNGEEYDHPILSTQAVFDTEEAAIQHGKDLVAEIRALDLATV